MGLPERWDTCSRTILLEARPGAFAYWGDLIATGMESEVVLLDAITGNRTSVLTGHTEMIASLAFSQDGTLIVSRSYDETIKLWDVQTGGVVRTFSVDTSLVLSVSISPDGTTVASGADGAICLWDVRTGKGHSIETGQDDGVSIIRFSPIDSRRFISSSRGGNVWQWDVDGHQIGISYHEADGVSDVAYTLDGTRFVTCGGRVATVRDSESGAVVVKFEVPGGALLARCCVLPGGRFVACAGRVIWVWDLTTPEVRLVGRLVGHSDIVSSVFFSSSLISVSWDRSVKFWQSSTFLADSITDHMAALHGSTQIVSVNLFAEDSTVVTTDCTGVVKTWDLMTGTQKSSFSTPAAGDCDTHLAGDTLIIASCADIGRECHIWDVCKGQLIQKFPLPFSGVNDFKISGDGSKIFWLCADRIIATAIPTGEKAGVAEVGKGVGQSCLLVDGSRVGIDDSPGKGWDFGGEEVSAFGESSDSRPRLDLAGRSTGRGVKPRWVEDTVTKRLVFRLPERCMKSGTRLGWDGRYLRVWSRSGEVVIMDFDPVFPR